MLLAVATCAQGAEPDWTDLTVRLYHDGALAEADEARALATASGILAAADVSLRWMHCHKGTAPDPGCTRPPAPRELTLRLTRTARPPAAAARALPLGDAFVTKHGSSAALATLYLERVDHLASHSRTDAGMLLGRAIAHELTHLLTQSSRHSTVGLMRPLWSAAELAREQAADWALDSASVTAVRARTTASMTLARKSNSP